MQFEFIMPVTKMTQEAQRTLSGRDGWSLSENQEASSIPTPDDKGSGSLRDGRWRGGDPAMEEGHVREEGQGVVSGRWQNRELGAVCATNNPAAWLLAWRCETTHRARPGGEWLPLVTIPAKAISKEQCAGLWQPGA